MPLPDTNNWSSRIYELLKETDLENLSYAQFQGVAEKLFIEPENEDEMRRLVLVQLARMAVRGDWDGFLTGSTGTIGGSTTEDLIAFGAATSDTITKDAGIKAITKSGDTNSAIRVGGIDIGGSFVRASTSNGSISIISDGSGQLFLTGGTDFGGTFTNSVVNIMKNTLSDSGQLKFRDGSNAENATITETSGELNVKSNVDAKDITLETKTTGLVRVKNQTTNTDTQLNVQGNGTGTPKINLSNDSKAVTIQCDESQKLKIIGASDDFIFDVSSATGGITFPDGTTQTTAAGGVSQITAGTGITISPVSGLGNVTINASGGSSAKFPTPLGNFDSTYKYLNIGTAAPYGVNTSSVSGRQGNYALNTRPRAFPFIAPASAVPVTMSIIQSTTGTGTATIGIYSANSDNYPDTLVATGTYDPTSTGTKTVTNTLSTALVGGELYFYVVRCTNNGGNLQAIKEEFVPSIFPGFNISVSSTNTCLTLNNITSGTALPTTAAFGSGNPSDLDRLHMWLEF